MSQYVLEKPHIYNKKWLVFPNATFSDLQITDCNDTISGICYRDKSFDECVDLCANSKNNDCGAGYYITKDNENICVPIRTSIHPLLNPAFRLRNKNVHPVLDDMEVNTFVNTDQYPFPPKLPNAVFFEDSFSLQNVKTGLELEIPVGKKLQTSRVHMGDPPGMHLQLLPFRTSMERIQYYIPMKYRSPVVFNIPGTSLIIIKGDDMKLKWAARILNTPQIENTFKIHSVNHPNQDIAFYNDTVYITYQDTNIVTIGANNNLEVMYQDYQTAKSNGENVEFKLIPKIQSYYCDNGECKPVKLQDTDTNKDNATYKNSPVTRNPKCWGLCDYITSHGLDLSSSSTSSVLVPIVLIIVGLIVVFGIFMFIVKRKH